MIKTKEEILMLELNQNHIDLLENTLLLEEYVMDAMQEYADQQTKELREEIERLKESKWISVEERLPDFNIDVFIYYFPKTPMMCGKKKGISKRIETKEKFLLRMLDENQFQLASKVTHWQPLPNNPI